MFDDTTISDRRIPYETIPGEDYQIIDAGADGKFECYGYKYNWFKKIVFYSFTIILLGIPLLLTHWYKEWKVYAKCKRCALSDADVLLLKDSLGQYGVGKVFQEKASLQNPVRHFTYRLVRYAWDPDIQFFQKIYGLQGDDGQPKKVFELLEDSRGYTIQEQEALLRLYGENVIEVEVKSYGRLFIEEVFHPFYLFQICSVVLWGLDEYYYYAGCVIFISALSLAVSLYETKRQSIMLSEMVSATHQAMVTVCRKDGRYSNIPVNKLVPGDLIVIPEHGFPMPCDAMLLAGNCIVNESMLTVPTGLGYPAPYMLPNL